MTNFVKHVFFAKVGKVGESDPFSSDPLSSDPLSSDPLSSDIETILLRAGTKGYIRTNAVQKRYKKLQKGTKTVQRRYKSNSKTVHKRYKSGT